MTATSTEYTIAAAEFEPAYLALHRTGELKRRAEQALAGLKSCQVCPRNCRVDRLAGKTATCKTGRYAQVASYFAHPGEEDCLRGRRGSGTIFFSMCNLRCVFCQNYDISQGQGDNETGPLQLAEMMLELQAAGCHNINFVTPEHVVPQVLEALVVAVEAGLRLPLVYNTSAYDSLESLRLLDGVVDIYMPDFKFWDAELAQRYLKARNYPDTARQALREMQRQVGVLKFDEEGLAKRGVLVRHLVMPGLLEDTRQILTFLAREVAAGTYVNVMAQYRPAARVSAQKYAEINRHVTSQEYRTALQMAGQAGLRLDERRPGIFRLL